MHAFNHSVRNLKVLCILLPPFNKTLLGETVTSCNATFMAYWSGQAVCYCVKPTFHIYNNRLFFCQLWFNDMTSVAHGSLVEPVFINTTHGERQNYMQNRKKRIEEGDTHECKILNMATTAGILSDMFPTSKIV